MKIGSVVALTIISLAAYVSFAAPTHIQGADLLKEGAVSVKPGPRGLVVVFLSSKCPCSNSHLNELKDLAKQYPQFNFVGVHSNLDERRDISQMYFQNAALPFPVIEDHELELANELHALKTPHAFVVAANGKILYQGGVTDSRDAGSADRHYLRDALDEISHDRPVETPQARTLGCIISRSH
jgi:hypothetical protein